MERQIAKHKLIKGKASCTKYKCARCESKVRVRNMYWREGGYVCTNCIMKEPQNIALMKILTKNSGIKYDKAISRVYHSNVYISGNKINCVIYLPKVLGEMDFKLIHIK